MALWLIRAGKYGEHKQRFFADSACYLTWEGTEDRDLHRAKDYEGIKALLAELYPDARSGRARRKPLCGRTGTASPGKR